MLVLEPGGGAYRQCRGTASRALHGSGNTSCGSIAGLPLGALQRLEWTIACYRHLVLTTATSGSSE
jgi:hypothetical protein